MNVLSKVVRDLVSKREQEVRTALTEFRNGKASEKAISINSDALTQVVIKSVSQNEPESSRP